MTVATVARVNVGEAVANAIAGKRSDVIGTRNAGAGEPPEPTIDRRILCLMELTTASRIVRYFVDVDVPVAVYFDGLAARTAEFLL